MTMYTASCSRCYKPVKLGPTGPEWGEYPGLCQECSHEMAIQGLDPEDEEC